MERHLPETRPGARISALSWSNGHSRGAEPDQLARLDGPPGGLRFAVDGDRIARVGGSDGQLVAVPLDRHVDAGDPGVGDDQRRARVPTDGRAADRQALARRRVRSRAHDQQQVLVAVGWPRVRVRSARRARSNDDPLARHQCDVAKRGRPIQRLAGLGAGQRPAIVGNDAELASERVDEIGDALCRFDAHHDVGDDRTVVRRGDLGREEDLHRPPPAG